MKIGIVAGEASGDMLGAKLIQALKTHYPDLIIEGMGGHLMAAEGCHCLYDSERLSMMGFIEPLFHLPELIRLRRDLYQHFIHMQPDVVIGIDSPDFNLGLELKLRAAGIPVIHYVSPSVWAWRQGRVRKIKKAVNLMLTLFPFEAAFYEKHHVPVRYVGHPLAETIPLQPDVQAARRALNIASDVKVVALLPGSRRQEIKFMGPVYLQAAKLLFQKNPKVVFVTPQANEARYQEFSKLHQAIAPELPLVFTLRRANEVITAADAVVVTSGTATLEVMLHKKPMVIAYRMSRITHWLAKRLVKSKFVGLPNLIADRALVPELIQEKATPENIANHIESYLNDAALVKSLQVEFTRLHQSLKMASQTIMIEAVKQVSDNKLIQM